VNGRLPNELLGNQYLIIGITGIAIGYIFSKRKFALAISVVQHTFGNNFFWLKN